MANFVFMTFTVFWIKSKYPQFSESSKTINYVNKNLGFLYVSTHALLNVLIFVISILYSPLDFANDDTMKFKQNDLEIETNDKHGEELVEQSLQKDLEETDINDQVK